MAGRHHLFREKHGRDHAPVTYIELFFDLVFVFAITQISHRFLDHLTWMGAAETIVLLLAVWWVWIYTSWATNWMDPDRAPVRLMLLAIMGVGLVMSSAIPAAFDGHGLMFAIAYCTIQIGRTLYMAWAAHGVNAGRQRNFLRIAFWFALSAPLWIAGALAEPGVRIALWVAALAIEYIGPFAMFRTPGLGRSTQHDWDISGAHMAERCALFIIIALGEGVLVTGATFADTPQDRANWIAFLTSFVGSATLWWIYFDVGAKRGSEAISALDSAGLMARNAYTYLHIPIVAGLVLTAVGDEMMIVHPVGHVSIANIVPMVGGPMLFLIGNLFFKWMSSGLRYPPLSHGIGLIGLSVLGVTAQLLHWQPLAIGLAATALLILTALWEWISLHGGWQRWFPWTAPLFSRTPPAS